MTNFAFEAGADGVAIARLDVPSRSMNTLTPDVVAEFDALIDRIAGDESIKGLVLASGKDNGFCAGADLGHQSAETGAQTGEAARRAAFDRAFRFNALLRKMETCGKPVAIALEGLALGGGLEWALACHYRVAARHPKMQLGLPEATIGLLPGGGGTQRLPRMIGVAKALPFLLEGKPVDADKALAAGIVDAVVEPGEAIEAARGWILAVGTAEQPWDRKDYKLPGGGPYTPTGGPAFIGTSATILKKSYGNFPAQKNILQAVYEGVQVPIDAGLRIETQYFVLTRQSPQAKAMIRTQFHSIQALRKGALRPEDVPVSDVTKAGVIGAGTMGAGIAYVQAAAGIETVLIDVTQEAADKGLEHSRKLVEKGVAAGRMTAQAGDALLARLTATTDYAQLRGSDIIVEAVFEDRTLKADITKLAEAELDAGAIFGSNTSTLPITSLAEASARPENFIGIHFFSPVNRMDLVEVIVGKKTSRETLAKALDYVASIRKTPIVVNDSRGFYTSRCFATYSAEGCELFLEGVAPAIIDNVGRATGMPRGPLELLDDVALDLINKVRKQTRADLGDAFKADARDIVVPLLVDTHGRFGRRNGKGFYDYPADGSAKTLWPGLADIAPVVRAASDRELVEEIRTRLLFRQALEAARCLEEGVITDPRSGDVGAVLGWGFARWTGGPLGLIDVAGASEFVAACDRLAAKCGPRFSPPQFLRALAVRGGSIYDGPLEKAA